MTGYAIAFCVTFCSDTSNLLLVALYGFVGIIVSPFVSTIIYLDAEYTWVSNLLSKIGCNSNHNRNTNPTSFAELIGFKQAGHTGFFFCVLFFVCHSNLRFPVIVDASSVKKKTETRNINKKKNKRIHL